MKRIHSAIQSHCRTFVAMAAGILLFNTATMAQTNRPAMNRWAVGLRLTNLYDLKVTSYDLLNNGFAGEDLYGFNGSKTKFDLAYGLDLTYFWSSVVSVDLNYDRGTITGANKIDYYKADINFLQAGVNLDLKTRYRSKPYNWVPYVRASFGRAGYDSKRYFVVDDGLFHTESGASMVTGLGLGMRYHLNHNWHLMLQSEYTVIHSDAVDGYNYGSGRENLLKSTFALRYTFGKNSHQDRGLAWQAGAEAKDYDAVLKAMQDSLGYERGRLNATQKDIALIQEKFTKDSDKDGVPDIKDHCPDVAANTPSGCPEKPGEKGAVQPTQAPVVSSGSGNAASLDIIRLEMNPVYFENNSSALTTKSKQTLDRVVKILKNNSSLNVEVVGMADDVGGMEHNMRLSQARAKVVMNYLISKGIESNRLSSRAEGSQPRQIYLNELNRRVEFRAN
ncbi:MAG: OmpA family protein [Bacteroidetes bacterium]|nr:OmpA family protein [Bacteroidota bacterium]